MANRRDYYCTGFIHLLKKSDSKLQLSSGLIHGTWLGVTVTTVLISVQGKRVLTKERKTLPTFLQPKRKVRQTLREYWQPNDATPVLEPKNLATYQPRAHGSCHDVYHSRHIPHHHDNSQTFNTRNETTLFNDHVFGYIHNVSVKGPTQETEPTVPRGLTAHNRGIPSQTLGQTLSSFSAFIILTLLVSHGGRE